MEPGLLYHLFQVVNHYSEADDLVIKTYSSILPFHNIFVTRLSAKKQRFNHTSFLFRHWLQCIIFIHFYSTSHNMSLLEALPTSEIDTLSEFTRQRAMGNCKWRTCPSSLRGGCSGIRTHNPLVERHRFYQCATTHHDNWRPLCGCFLTVELFGFHMNCLGYQVKDMPTFLYSSLPSCPSLLVSLRCWCVFFFFFFFFFFFRSMGLRHFTTCYPLKVRMSLSNAT